MKKKNYTSPTIHIIILEGGNMMQFHHSIPKHDGTGVDTGGGDAESKEFFMNDGWDIEETD